MFEKKKNKEFEKQFKAADKKNKFTRYTKKMIDAYTALLEYGKKVTVENGQEYEARLQKSEKLLSDSVTFIENFYATSGNSYTFLVDAAGQIEDMAKKPYGTADATSEAAAINRERIEYDICDVDILANLSKVNEGLDGVATYVENHPEAAKETDKLYSYYISECRGICEKWMELEKAGETSETTKSEFIDLLKHLNDMILQTKHELYENVRTEISVDASVEKKMMGSKIV